MTKKSAVTAVHKLELSKIDPRQLQQELMGKDLDLEKLVVYLRSQIKFNAAGQVVDVNVTRTIEGASTVVVSLLDYDRTVLNSGLLNSRLDIQVDGLWFRLVSVSRSPGSSQLDLTFEDREIAILRTYPPKDAPHHGVKFVHRKNTTRAEFILNLIREVKEFKIPVVIPELHKVQPIERSTDLPTVAATPPVSGTSGINNSINRNPGRYANPPTGGAAGGAAAGLAPHAGAGAGLMCKNVLADKEQIQNANIIIGVGKQMNMPRKVIVCAIMTATQESTLRNLSGGDAAHGGGKQDSAGLFQQYYKWGSYRDRTDPATSSRLFYNACIQQYKYEPNDPYWKICADTQNPAAKNRELYKQWYLEANAWVAAFGITGGDTETNTANANLMDRSTWGGGTDGTKTASDYVFFRGTPEFAGKIWKREDNWTCITRLAGEVQWRAFFVSGVFYLMSEDDLLKTQPIMILDETSPGVDGIGFDYDIGKKFATVNIPMRVGLWTAPPGGVVALQHMGPVSGRWIVSDYSRSVFNENAQVNLKKPMPVLPEPIVSDVSSIPTWAVGSGKKSGKGASQSADAAQFGGGAGADGSRTAVVAVADQAWGIEHSGNHYCYPPDERGDGTRPARPIPDSLWSADAHAGIDCSAFATLCYKEAGCPDPNGNNYNGSGNTSTLIAHCRRVSFPSPGDLVFYSGKGDIGYPGHVAVYIGQNKVCEMGSSQGITIDDMNYRSDLIAYASGFPL
jgi:hypothetical protein